MEGQWAGNVCGICNVLTCRRAVYSYTARLPGHSGIIVYDPEDMYFEMQVRLSPMEFDTCTICFLFLFTKQASNNCAKTVNKHN